MSLSEGSRPVGEVKKMSAIGREMAAKKLWERAHQAGLVAVENCKPAAVVFGSGKSLFSSEIDRSKPVFLCNDGPCGFAWIRISPARGALVGYLKKAKIGRMGYSGGWEVWVSLGRQSMSLKEAYAEAVSAELRKAGISAYMQSRMD